MSHLRLQVPQHGRWWVFRYPTWLLALETPEDVRKWPYLKQLLLRNVLTPPGCGTGASIEVPGRKRMIDAFRRTDRSSVVNLKKIVNIGSKLTTREMKNIPLYAYLHLWGNSALGIQDVCSCPKGIWINSELWFEQFRQGLVVWSAKSNLYSGFSNGVVSSLPKNRALRWTLDVEMEDVAANTSNELEKLFSSHSFILSIILFLCHSFDGTSNWVNISFGWHTSLASFKNLRRLCNRSSVSIRRGKQNHFSSGSTWNTDDRNEGVSETVTAVEPQLKNYDTRTNLQVLLEEARTVTTGTYNNSLFSIKYLTELYHLEQRTYIHRDTDARIGTSQKNNPWWDK